MGVRQSNGIDKATNEYFVIFFFFRWQALKKRGGGRKKAQLKKKKKRSLENIIAFEEIIDVEYENQIKIRD